MSNYRVELAKSGRAGCQSKICKDEGIKIGKDTLRLGSWVDTDRVQFYSWRHWGCVTAKQLSNVADAVQGDYDQLDGFSDLSKEMQDKVQTAIELGHVDNEDKNEDVEALIEAAELEKAQKQAEKDLAKEAQRAAKEREKEEKKLAKELEKEKKKRAKEQAKEAKLAAQAVKRAERTIASAQKDGEALCTDSSDEDSPDVKGARSKRSTRKPHPNYATKVQKLDSDDDMKLPPSKKRRTSQAEKVDNGSWHPRARKAKQQPTRRSARHQK